MRAPAPHRPAAVLQVAPNIWYFEVTWQRPAKDDCNSPATLAVGWAFPGAPGNALPGTMAGAVALHSDDGCVWAHGAPHLFTRAAWAPGDVCGCGLDLATGAVFYTRNGCRLGAAAVLPPRRRRGLRTPWPAIGIVGTDTKATVNVSGPFASFPDYVPHPNPPPLPVPETDPSAACPAAPGPACGPGDAASAVASPPSPQPFYALPPLSPGERRALWERLFACAAVHVRLLQLLPLADRARCAAVCRRWAARSRAEELWETVAPSKAVDARALAAFLRRAPRHLDLLNAHFSATTAQDWDKFASTLYAPATAEGGTGTGTGTQPSASARTPSPKRGASSAQAGGFVFGAPGVASFEFGPQAASFGAATGAAGAQWSDAAGAPAPDAAPGTAPDRDEVLSRLGRWRAQAAGAKAEHVRMLAAVPPCPAVESLTLFECSDDPDVVMALLPLLPGLRRLRGTSVHGCVKAGALEALGAHCPALRCLHLAGVEEYDGGRCLDLDDDVLGRLFRCCTALEDVVVGVCPGLGLRQGHPRFLCGSSDPQPCGRVRRGVPWASQVHCPKPPRRFGSSLLGGGGFPPFIVGSFVCFPR